MDIAKHNQYKLVRFEAVKRINDESALVDVAKKNSNDYVRMAAIEKINNQSVLIDIANNDKSSEVLREVIRQIRDEPFLIDVAKNNSDEYVREEAVKKIINETVLIDIAKNDPSYRVRKATVQNNNLKDKDVLEYIAKHDEYCEASDSFTRSTGKVIGFSDHDGNEYEREKVTVYEYPVRKAANSRLGGKYDTYCERENTYII